ncbi:MAG TPA: phosphoribosyltransferase family protein [Candidatus Saccharimonadales bacterium]
MYFASRLQAGRMLASQISRKYEGQDCAVVALSDGGVVVGAQVALQLHAVINLLLADQIQLPRELVAMAGITQDGSFSYNRAFSDGEIEEMVGEYRGFIEQQKLEKLHDMHRSMGGGVLIRPELVAKRHVILVSDGLNSGFAIDLAMQYLKTISIKSIIVATPFASIAAVDRMHILADDIYCLNVLEDYISTDHYYDTMDVPEHEVVISTVEKIVRDWKSDTSASS